jgi:hypothetical protein
MDSATRAALLARYRNGYQLVVDALEGASDDELDVAPPDGGWTARQVVHHLADGEMTSAVRLRRLLAEDEPSIDAYDQDEFARRLHYDRPLEGSLAAVWGARLASAALLERLTDEEWARAGTHPEHGRYGVDDWLTIYAVHAEEHAAQITALRSLVRSR